VDGDGLDDIFVGARNYEYISGAGYSTGAGKAYLFLGTSAGIATPLAAYGFLGENAGDHAGHSVSSAGDVNGDGLDDLLVGAPHAESNEGKAYLILSDL
jgi:hypothetical protein